MVIALLVLIFLAILFPGFMRRLLVLVAFLALWVLAVAQRETAVEQQPEQTKQLKWE